MPSSTRSTTTVPSVVQKPWPQRWATTYTRATSPARRGRTLLTM